MELLVSLFFTSSLFVSWLLSNIYILVLQFVGCLGVMPQSQTHLTFFVFHDVPGLLLSGFAMFMSLLGVFCLIKMNFRGFQTIYNLYIYMFL